MTLEESKTDDDILQKEYGVSLIADKKLTTLLEGTIVDFVESENGKGFEIRKLNSGSGRGFKVYMANSGAYGSCGKSY